MTNAILLVALLFYPACALLGWWIGERISRRDLERRQREASAEVARVVTAELRKSLPDAMAHYQRNPLRRTR